MFGTPALRQIAKKQGFAKVEMIDDENDLTTLILLKMGFNVPPSIIGLNYYIFQLKQCQKDLSETKGIRQKSGVMTQVYVATESILRDLVFFYAHSLWPKTIERFKSELEEKKELTNLQRKTKTVERVLKKKFNIEKPFDRLGFGDFVDILSRFNNTIRKKKRVKIRMEKAFERSYVLPKETLDRLLLVSPCRASFAHVKDFPGDEVCENIIMALLNFGDDLQKRRIYPMVLRISCEIEDEYGRAFVEAIDENGDKWTVYTRKRMEPILPYFMYSKPERIAIAPILVQKIR